MVKALPALHGHKMEQVEEKHDKEEGGEGPGMGEPMGDALAHF